MYFKEEGSLDAICLPVPSHSEKQQTQHIKTCFGVRQLQVQPEVEGGINVRFPVLLLNNTTLSSANTQKVFSTRRQTPGASDMPRAHMHCGACAACSEAGSWLMQVTKVRTVQVFHIEPALSAPGEAFVSEGKVVPSKG